MQADHQHAHRAGLAALELAAPAARIESAGAPSAAPADLNPPHKDETHQLAGVVGSKEQGKADTLNRTDIGPADQAKALATLTAQAARIGCQVHELASGGFLVCRWGMARELPDIAAVGAFLKQMGARE